MGKGWKMMSGGFYFVELPSKKMSRSVNKSENIPLKFYDTYSRFPAVFLSIQRKIVVAL